MILYNGDCLEIMKTIKDHSVDMVLCDLPYGTTQNKWDSVIPFELLWQQYNRIIKLIVDSDNIFKGGNSMASSSIFIYEQSIMKSFVILFPNSLNLYIFKA